MSVKDEIVAVLRELGGEVVSPEGLATRQVAERVASTGSFTAVSTALGQLERDGIVERDQPQLKRTTRIALAGPGVRPGRKGAAVLAERASRVLARELESELDGVLDGLEQAHQAALEAAEERARAHALASERTRRERDEAREEARVQHAAREAAETEVAELREELQIARHNAGVWQRQALERPRVRELLSTVSDQLTSESRRDLEQLMRSLPRERE